MNLPARIVAKITFGECWEWTGAINGSGYGNAWLHGKVRRAHRVVYEVLVGPIPAGLELDHLCRNRKCVRPEHLEPVSHKVNSLRSSSPVAGSGAVTQCPKGHPYDAANTKTTRDGARQCRICANDSSRRRYYSDPRVPARKMELMRTPEARARKHEYDRKRRESL